MFIKHYIIAFITFIIIDAVWLAFIAKNLYQAQIGFLMKENVNWLAALLFYIIFIAGLTFFAINPSILKQSLVVAVAMGAFFGLVTYSTYDLTNLATIKNWPLTVTIIDLIWGSFISGAVSGITFLVAGKI